MKITILHGAAHTIDLDAVEVAQINTDRYPDAVLEFASVAPNEELPEVTVLLEGSGKVTALGVTRWAHGNNVLQAPGTLSVYRSRHNQAFVWWGAYAPAATVS